jgi:hypothetical protein
MQDISKNLSDHRAVKNLVSINGGKQEKTIFYLSCAGSFSIVFYVYEWQSYVFFFSYRKAYAKTFLMFINEILSYTFNIVVNFRFQ